MAAINYDKATGDGTLRIKDLNDGSDNIEFWAQAGYTNFHWSGLEFSTTTYAGTQNHSTDFALGAAWTKVATRLVRESGPVTFKLLDTTNTQSMAGPTTHTITINRDTVPPATDQPILTNIGSTQILVDINTNGDGGDPINLRQIGYGTSSSVSNATIITTDGYDYVTGLTPGTTYYFWGRVRNSIGYSAWSPRASAKTLSGPSAPTKAAISSITQSSIVATFAPNANGGSAIIDYQIAYSKTASVTGAPTITTTATSRTVAGLSPGTVYYFWVRARNAIGWSAWSAVSSARTLAGMYIKNGNVWVAATPYVNVGGVWKVARPFVRQGGFWKEAI